MLKKIALAAGALLLATHLMAADASKAPRCPSLTIADNFARFVFIKKVSFCSSALHWSSPSQRLRWLQKTGLRSIWVRPHAIRPLDDVPPVHQTAWLKDQKGRDDSTQENIHHCENNISAQEGKVLDQ